jgi:hypothetical protein
MWMYSVMKQLLQGNTVVHSSSILFAYFTRPLDMNTQYVYITPYRILYKTEQQDEFPSFRNIQSRGRSWQYINKLMWLFFL